MNESFLKQNAGTISDTLIVTFASYNKTFGLLPRFEFANFLENHFSNVDRHFYVDHILDLYHKGIRGISANIDETVVYLKGEIAKYKNVIFVGVSAGGYAAILFGSLLNIQSVLAFIPQTLRLKPHIDERYRDISPYINGHTQYYLYGDMSIINETDCHHISHCERISHHPNVFLVKKNRFNAKQMRDNGELLEIFTKLINEKIMNLNENLILT
jgi:hypothetical protein